MLRDKKRHAQFGWLYLAQRKAELDAPAIARRAGEMLERFYASGLMVPGFQPAIAGDVAAAIERGAAGLRFSSLKDQKQATAGALDEARARFAALSIDAARLVLPA